MPKLETLGPEEGRRQLIENLELATKLARQGRAMTLALAVRPSGLGAEDQFVVMIDAPPTELPDDPEETLEDFTLDARSRLLYLLDVTLEECSRLMLQHQSRMNRNPFGQAFKDMGYTKYHILTHDEIKKLLVAFLIQFGVGHTHTPGKDETAPNMD
ncbi:MAG: hypothetical protein IT442_04885 [Phycisphaeraceae bacterium]|nr:hypothetical protein [Phycisphaeraceae bacterium]